MENDKDSRRINSQPGFPIVGMGASAGGLEAFELFFKTMPLDSGIAFVLVSHLDPSHISLLPDLIQKKTKMVTSTIKDGTEVKPNMVYVIPPNKDVAILNGVLHLMDLPQPRGNNLPIDNFFKSLAQDQGQNAIGIILSGTGSDGTIGLRHIKNEMGIVMVQDENSAKYSGMPNSAISTGMVDYIIPVDKMPGQLLNYTKHYSNKLNIFSTSEADQFNKALQKIFILLRSHTNHDFSSYKKNTIIRRIERRMHIHQIDLVDDYVRYLQANDREIHTLFKDLLIGVTSFFRDPEAFDILQSKTLPALLSNKPDRSPLRIWVAGCSSGEEAYSIAILIQECLETLKKQFDVQIFATDLDEDAINVARVGLYPISIAGEVTDKRLKKFFISEDGCFRVKKSIREMLVFAPQNIIKDPPFTKLDLLTCRNLLIYMDAKLQKKILSMFHYSLNTDGVLFLGSSESIGQGSMLFSTQDKKWKIFKRLLNVVTTYPTMNFPISMVPETAVETKANAAVKKADEINNYLLVENILKQSDMPPCVIVDGSYNIVYTHGRTGKYLEPAIGQVSINIIEMARPGLKTPLAAAVRKVSALKQEVVQKGVEIQGEIRINLIVKPFLEYGTIHGMLLVMFQDITQEVIKVKTKKTKKNRELEQLEQELQYVKENLQTTIEELETTNEELKSTNEELQSTNEELQSTNEELETSKEELQSLNEESSMVNTELQSRIDELSDANDDMKNLLDSTCIGTIFLDIDLNVKRFNNIITHLIPLSYSDIGRPISHFATKLISFNLVEHANRVLNDLIVQEYEVDSIEHKCFRTKIRPYRTIQNVIDGVVVTFEDITEFKQFEFKSNRLNNILSESKDAVIIQEKDGNIAYWNKGAEKMYGHSSKKALKMNIRELVPTESIPDALALIQHAVKDTLPERLETERLTKDGSTIRVELTVTCLKDKKGNPNAIATIERKITGVA